MKQSVVKHAGSVACSSIFFFLVSLLVLASCGEDAVTERIVEKVSETIDTVYVQGGRDTVLVAEDTVVVSKKDTVVVTGDTIVVFKRDTLFLAGDTVVIHKVDTVQVSKPDTILVPEESFSCTTESLPDSSGVKIVCNGDSIGVVLNGAEQEEKEISISGFVQKGPFLKEASVKAVELDGALLPTEKSFEVSVVTDDGKYSIDGISPGYWQISATGYYRNEVTGKNSTEPITLNALIVLDSRNTVNVNLMTHLEYERVRYLAEHSEGSVDINSLKKQAEKEIFNAFHFDEIGSGYAEDWDIFGETDEDAALLAISILLQGNRSEEGLVNLLSSISDDMKEDGVWDNAATKSSIADWALEKDGEYMTSTLPSIQQKMFDWKISSTAADFEKYIRRFASVESGLGVCGVDVAVGIAKNVPNENSKYYTSSFTDIKSRGKKNRFICEDAQTSRWRLALYLECDRSGLDVVKDGTLLKGGFTGKLMVWDADTIRYASDSEISLNRGCVSYIRDGSYVLDGQLSYYKCTSKCWVFDVAANTGIMKDSRDNKSYRTITVQNQVWMAENLDFDYKVKGESYGTYVHPEYKEKYGRYYTWAAALDSAAVFSKNSVGCGFDETPCNRYDPVRGICPEGWHIPSIEEWTKLYNAMGKSTYAMEATGYKDWTLATDEYGFSAVPAGLYSYADETINSVGRSAFFWTINRYDYYEAYYWNLYNGNSNLNYYFTKKNNGLSVRCVKD